MLKLKRVEIHGFKSFYNRTEMKFSGSGIAAVVGPNGCGKSNLSDAISWVLGEQSAKTLRGGRMEDVIFAGTRDRKALGMASVTMTLIPDEAALAVSRMPLLLFFCTPLAFFGGERGYARKSAKASSSRNRRPVADGSHSETSGVSGSGENHVFHAAAAQSFRRLLTT